MKNSLKILSVLLASSILLGSCIKETFPKEGVATDEQVKSSQSALQALVNGFSAGMMKINTAGYQTTYGTQADFGIPAVHLAIENMVEDFATIASNPGYNWFGRYGQNLAQGETYIYCAYFWDVYYQWIRLSNIIIPLIDPETANDETIGYLGQAYAYRAMFYLDMARLFEPKPNNYTDVSAVLGLTVPIATEETTDEISRNNPRAPREVMYAFILSDLEKAAEYLENANYSYTSPTLGVVYGLYARAYLEMGAAGDAGAYQEAARYARLAITTSGRTPLTQTQWEDPINGFNNGAANNSWMLGLTLTSEQTNNLCNFTGMICSEASWSYAMAPCFYGASVSFYNRIPANDFRKHSWIDPGRLDFYNYKLCGDAAYQADFLDRAPDYAHVKFRPAGGDVVSYETGNEADHPLMRVEEMYFIEMEATAHTDLGAARTMLNDFMKFRVLDGSYDCTSSTGSLGAFLDEMLFQKRVEFWGEGITFYDYKRLDVGITRGYPGTNHPGTFAFNTNGRAPFWNIVITRGESQGNTAITAELNNPDPTGQVDLWVP